MEKSQKVKIYQQPLAVKDVVDQLTAPYDKKVFSRCTKLLN